MRLYSITAAWVSRQLLLSTSLVRSAMLVPQKLPCPRTVPEDSPFIRHVWPVLASVAFIRGDVDTRRLKGIETRVSRPPIDAPRSSRRMKLSRARTATSFVGGRGRSFRSEMEVNAEKHRGTRWIDIDRAADA